MKAIGICGSPRSGGNTEIKPCIAFGRIPGEVENDAEGLATVDRFGDNLAWLAAKLR